LPPQLKDLFAFLERIHRIIDATAQVISQLVTGDAFRSLETMRA
jgi:hypothetical protein